MHSAHRVRPILTSLLAFTAALAFALPDAQARAAEPTADTSPPPNILLILIDDLGYSDLAPYGSEVSTPNIAALASHGVLFSDYHASPMCAPSRAMIMTGVSSHRAGVGNLPEFIPPSWTDKPGYLGHLAPDAVTIAQRLKPLGYDTFMTGKWHLGHDPDTLPSARGFDKTFILDATGADNWQDRSYLPLQDALWYENGKRTHLPADYYSSRNLVDKMIEYIGDREDTQAPFFAYLALQAVHIPVQAPREFTQKYLDTYAKGWNVLREARREAAVAKGIVPADAPMRPIPETLRDWDKLSDADRAMAIKSMAVYAGMIEAMDYNVGRLLDHLKATGQLDNTVVIVTSDNGAEGTDPLALASMRAWLPFSGYNRDLDTLGELGSYVFIGPEFANAASAPGAWFKFTSAEGGLRVPLIISAPGMSGTRIEHGLAWIEDIPATIYDYATSRAAAPRSIPSAASSSAPASATPTSSTPTFPSANPHELTPDLSGPAATNMTGRSLRPLLEGTATAIRTPNDIVGMEAAGHSALFQGDYKLTRIYPPHGDKKWRLYDIQSDPGETADLAAKQPVRFQAMLAAYQVWADANHVIPIPDDYEAFKQIQINFMHQLWQTKPWIFAIPVVGLAIVVAGLWGVVRLVRRLVA